MIIEELASRYYQLYLEPSEGGSKSELYTDIVLHGEKPDCVTESFPAGFSGSEDDALTVIQTPAGNVEIAYLSNRSDFIRLVQVLAYQCENKSVPPTMGAITIRGIINWRKIERHQKEFEDAGGSFFAWNEEFSKFTSDKKNYTDTLIVVSKGGYSGIQADQVGIANDEWLKDSFRIRTYHECTHFICRNLFPEKVDVLWDEIFADCIGLCSTFGTYKTDFAKLFLGIGKDGSYTGGRLENYFSKGTSMAESAEKAVRIIEKLDSFVKAETFDSSSSDSIFNLVLQIEKKYCM